MEAKVRIGLQCQLQRVTYLGLSTPWRW